MKRMSRVICAMEPKIIIKLNKCNIIPLKFTATFKCRQYIANTKYANSNIRCHGFAEHSNHQTTETGHQDNVPTTQYHNLV